MKLAYQDRQGLLPEHEGMTLMPAPYERVRLTIPAREALQAAGATIGHEASDGGPQTYMVQLSPSQRVPNLVACRIAGTDHMGLRRSDEPEYPGEIATLWEQVAFSGCPKCGKPLIWYEAGYVPGYRVCSGKAHHHVLVR